MSAFRRGDLVTYHPGGSLAPPEHGVVMEVRDPYVMVRYGADEHAKASRPGDLRKVTAQALIQVHRRPVDDLERLEAEHERSSP